MPTGVSKQRKHTKAQKKNLANVFIYMASQRHLLQQHESQQVLFIPNAFIHNFNTPTDDLLRCSSIPSSPASPTPCSIPQAKPTSSTTPTSSSFNNNNHDTLAAPPSMYVYQQHMYARDLYAAIGPTTLPATTDTTGMASE